MNKIYRYSWKKHFKISNVAKFGGEILYITENIVLRSLRILSDIFVLRPAKPKTFVSNVVDLPMCVKRGQYYQGHLPKATAHTQYQALAQNIVILVQHTIFANFASFATLIES